MAGEPAPGRHLYRGSGIKGPQPHLGAGRQLPDLARDLEQQLSAAEVTTVDQVVIGVTLLGGHDVTLGAGDPEGTRERVTDR